MSELTTPELLKKLHKSKMNVSHDQLKYWRRHGLLPKPHLRGKGRGLGVEQLWDEICIKNVRLIKESSEGKRINLKTAGKYLFARNMPIGTPLLQRSLLEIPHEMRENEKQRVKKSSDIPELAELIQFLTPENVREAIHQTDVSKLIYFYDNMNKFVIPLGAQVAWISSSHQVFDALVQTEFPDLTGMTSLSTEAVYRRQRSTLAWAILLDHYGETLNKIMMQVIQQLVFMNSSYPKMQPIVWPKN